MIEVGELIRTKTGYIGIVENINDYRPPETKICVDFNVPDLIFLGETDILKHSKNIIDLIEVGDYVNGYRILEKTKIKNNEMQICILKDNNCSNWRIVNDKTLKSIVTKEQFASMEYRVKEE